MRYRVLGPLAVEGVVDHPALRRYKPRALLALLLLHANEVVSTDSLLDGLWGESPPPRALGSLQNNVSHLRKVLGEDTLVTQAPGYLLHVGPDELDSDVFDRLVTEAASCEPAERAERLRSALGLWRGQAYADFTFEPFAQNEIRRLDELRLAALEERIDAELSLGRHHDVVGELEALVAEHPLRERLRGELMVALYRAGRQADALEVYRAGRDVLREELGLEPGDELRRLERAVLEQDPSLDVVAPHTVAAPPRAPAVRKVVTVLFADVAGHTRLTATLDPETIRNVMRRFFTAMSAVIERHGGTLEKFSGDDVMAVFGVPVAHEDDALRAVRAATEMRSALAGLGDELRREHGADVEMRIGINTGEVVAGDPTEVPLVTGEAVNIGKRLQQAAAPGEIVLGPVTLSLVRGAVETDALGPVELRGREGPLAVFRLVSMRATATGGSTDLAAPLVGRRKELRRLRSAFARAFSKRQPVLAVVLGDAGIGKTRLARELVTGLEGDADVLVGRCVSYGEGATYLPLVDVIRRATRDASLAELVERDVDAAQVAGALDHLSSPGDTVSPAAETAWAFWRFLENLASRRPVALVLEDLHWAEPTLLDLVEFVAERTANVPLAVLAIARPDLLERRPHWAEAAITLAPLGDDDAAALVSHLADESDVDPAVRAQIVAAAEGNPLFAEQLFAFVLERGPDALASLPPTIDALLASRLDGLDAINRAIVERAAVIGPTFRESEIVALSSPEEAGVVGGALATLVRRAFVRQRRVTAVTADTFAFHHALVRDAAYAAVPKARRAELHERFADWLAQRGHAPDEIVGYHLERAYRSLEELAPVTRHRRQLAVEAGERLGRAGMRAFQSGDLPAADNLLGRTTTLLPEDSERLRELLIELGLVRRLAGDDQRAEEALGVALAASERARDERLRLRAELELASFGLLAGHPTDEVLELAARGIPLFAAIGDDRSLGRAWLLRGVVDGQFRCRNADWEHALENALVHYRRAQWPTTACVGELAAALFYGPRPVAEAIERCATLLDEPDAGRAGSANALAWMSGLHAMRGGFAEAREGVARAREILEELGFVLAAASSCGHVAARTEMLARAPEEAEVILRRSCDAFEKFGSSAHLATFAADLAEALYAQNKLDEAEQWADAARRNTGESDISAQFSWRSILAKVLAQAGSVDEAEVLAREAVRIVDATDALNQQAEVYEALAEVQRLAGRADDATAALDEAAKRFTQKGNVVAASRVAESRSVTTF